MKKYSIMHDLVDDLYWIVERNEDRAEEIKVYESDSLHDCYCWGFANHKPLRAEVEVWCVYWSDFEENYYMCPDKKDGTLDDVCFYGSEEECEEYFSKKYIKDDDDDYFPCSSDTCEDFGPGYSPVD